jgi:AraC family transcriptional regulator
MSGSAVWEIPGRSFTVHENTCLLLNDRQRYAMTIESAHAASTFCVFFARGFVEDVFRTRTTPAQTLLDAAYPAAFAPLHFVECIEPQHTPFFTEFCRFQKNLGAGRLSSPGAEAHLFRLATALLAQHQDLERAASRLPAIRASTRSELFRRLLRGRDFLLSSLSGPSLALEEVARVACLSPYHFHRSFRAAFGEAPHRYVVRYRLARAAHLLRTTGRTVTEICMETGFESPASFSSLFHRFFHASPVRYRREKSAVALKLNRPIYDGPFWH